MDNYIVSARKYRPTTFASVVGQEALTRTLRNSIRSNHLAHAYLFCGPRGVGKTTCARIFAKTINCLNPTADHEPCNECESCQAFNEQRSFNIHELDAASNNSVDDIRNLINEVRIPPQIGHYSVYIIDEVHMLSSQAFNALLKTLEEPPSYVIFILATTEKQKILPTILSRCQVYDFARISIDDIVRHLSGIAQQEGITASEQALNVIAQKADGGLRDALSIFDQVNAFCAGNITYEQTLSVLNVLDYDYYFRLVRMASAGDMTGALLLFDEVLNKGFEAAYFISGLMQHLRDVLVAKDPASVSLLVASEAIREQYAAQAQACAAMWIFKALSLMNDCDIAYRTAKNKRLTVEIALIKLCQLNMYVAQPTTQPVTAQPAAQPTAKPVTPQPVPQPTTRPVTAQPKPQVAPTIPKITKPAAPQAAPSIPTLPKIPKPNPFTVDQLRRAWVGLDKVFATEARLQAMIDQLTPVIVEGDKCAITVTNPFQKTELKRWMPQILAHLKQELGNDGIELTIDVQEHERTQQAYTSQEKLKVLTDLNPEMRELQEKFHLQLD